MSYRSATEFIKEKGLCKTVGEDSGIYAIVRDNRVLYVGKSVNMKRRTRKHFWFALNFPIRHKYVLLNKAIDKGVDIDCVVLKPCEISHLDRCEKCCMEHFQTAGRKCPPLNNLFGQDITRLTYETFNKDLYNYTSRNLIDQSCLNAE